MYRYLQLHGLHQQEQVHHGICVEQSFPYSLEWLQLPRSEDGAKSCSKEPWEVPDKQPCNDSWSSSVWKWDPRRHWDMWLWIHCGMLYHVVHVQCSHLELWDVQVVHTYISDTSVQTSSTSKINCMYYITVRVILGVERIWFILDYKQKQTLHIESWIGHNFYIRFILKLRG